MTAKKASLAKATDDKPLVNISDFDEGEQKDVAYIINQLTQAFDSLRKAATRWSTLSPESQKALRLQPKMAAICDRMDMVGDGKLHPWLITETQTTVKLLSTFPVDEQEHLLTTRLKVAVTQDDDMMYDIREIPPALRSRVFKKDGDDLKVRSLREQRKWLKDKDEADKEREKKMAQMKKVEVPGFYKIEKKKLTIDPDRAKGLSFAEIEIIYKDFKQCMR